MNQYDVVIRMGEPRYWVLLSVSFAAGWALLSRFKALGLDRKDRALRRVGWILIALQVAYQVYMLAAPGFEWTVH